MQASMINNLSRQSEPFNEDLIFYREKDSILTHITEICKGMEVIKNITFLGATVEEDETKITSWGAVDIEKSRLSEVTVQFKIQVKDEEEIIERKFFIPRLVDNFFFILNDVKYFPIYQVVEATVFLSSKIYSLKTLLMPIRFKYKKRTFSDFIGEELTATEFNLNLFKHNISFLYYFFAEKGFEETLEFFGYEYGEEGDFFIKELTEKQVSGYSEDYYCFKLKKKNFLLANKESLQCTTDIDFLYALVNILTSNNKINEPIEVWKKLLGSTFSPTSIHEEKAESILFSLRRIFDNFTKRVLKIDEEDKKDIYTILRWMIVNFEELRYIDTMDLCNKRIQCWEYLTAPLLRYFSNSTYRILNTRNLAMKDLRSIFNINANFLIKRIKNNDLIRYNGAVNNIDLFSAGLKVTFRGPGSIGDGSDVADKFRDIHKSYIGRISLITTSAGDPGLSTTIVPFTSIKAGRFEPRPFVPSDNNVEE